MDNRRITIGWKLAWLAAMMIPLQPLWTLGYCGRVAFSSPVVQDNNQPCRSDNAAMHRPIGSCLDGAMCPDKTPTPAEPISRLMRRKQQWEQGDDLLPLATEVVVKISLTSQRAARTRSCHPLSASRRCVSLCRLRL